MGWVGGWFGQLDWGARILGGEKMSEGCCQVRNLNDNDLTHA